MFWRIYFHCDQAYAADFGAALEDHASAVAWFESKDPEIWVVEAITITQPIVEEFTKLLSPTCQKYNLQPPSLNVETLPDTDWLEATWRNFPPQQIGRYYVYGSHTDPLPPSDSVPLEINAATAFGSGEHETTTGCLLTLDDLATQGQTFQNPLDMGCGSGILAIATAKTWNVPVTAADNDPESIRVTTNNALLNHCDHLIHAYVSEGFSGDAIKNNGPYDLVVANILAEPLINMAQDLSNHLRPGGMVILSGLLTRHQADVINAYKAQGLHLDSLRTLNDWVALLLKKN